MCQDIERRYILRSIFIRHDFNLTIETSNFPANQNFVVRMGPFGTQAIGGAVVATTPSGAGGALRATYEIPAHLHGSQQIAIRMDSPQGFFSFNWFFNVTWSEGSPIGIGVGGPAEPVTPARPVVPAVPVCAPALRVIQVVADESITIEVTNLPPNRDFTIRMGHFSDQAIPDIVVGTTRSDATGTFTATYDIPNQLHDVSQLALRLDGPLGFFYYRWFFNTTWSEGSPVGIGPADPIGIGPAGPVAEVLPPGIPLFRIVGVSADQTVTIETSGFPANQNFVVRMGAFGTLGVGGTVVATTASGAGGAFRATYEIPARLHGSDRIAIRMDSPQGFFAHNWFFNTTWEE
jgi:hypothetical protein